MKLFKTIADYCKAINIDPPEYSHFDIRKFEDNMATVVNAMKPFRHEFYAVAIKVEGMVWSYQDIIPIFQMEQP